MKEQRCRSERGPVSFRARSEGILTLPVEALPGVDRSHEADGGPTDRVVIT